jgi:hypothetical protein
VGCVLLYFGFNATETFGEKLVEGVTGKYSDHTMRYLVGGAGTAAVGLLLTLFGKR